MSFWVRREFLETASIPRIVLRKLCSRYENQRKTNLVGQAVGIEIFVQAEHVLHIIRSICMGSICLVQTAVDLIVLMS